MVPDRVPEVVGTLKRTKTRTQAERDMAEYDQDTLESLYLGYDPEEEMTERELYGMRTGTEEEILGVDGLPVVDLDEE